MPLARRLELVHMALALSVREAEQAPVEVDIFKDAERRIEIATKPLGHVCNPANLGVPVCLVCHIAAEHNDPAFVDYANAGDETEQRGLAGGVRPDRSDHLAGRDIQGDIVKRKRLPITMGNALDLGDDVIHHRKASPRGLPATRRRGRS